MKYIVVLLITVLLVGCVNDQYIDQEARAKAFSDCMHMLPAGPVKTHYNDWDEVVAQCSSTAYYQSIRSGKPQKPTDVNIGF